VPAAIAIADFAGGDPARAIEISGNLRGDTDTVAAMAGAICGAFAGVDALPASWLETIATVNDLDVSIWSERLVRCAENHVKARA
jgi:ADP-ribosylglycohydrolase